MIYKLKKTKPKMSFLHPDKASRLCMVLFLIVFAAIVADVCTTDNQARTDGPMVAITAPQQMPVILNGDTSYVSLAKGDSVRILGFYRLTNSQRILVETSRGDRGYLQPSQLQLKQYVYKGKYEGDTLVDITTRYDKWHHISGYTARTATGEEIEVQASKFIPLFDGWNEMCISNTASTSVATQEGLEKCKGMTLAEIEGRYGMAMQIFVTKDGGKKASFRIYAYSPDWKVEVPTITFGADGRAEAFEYKALKDKANNGWLLGLLPFARTLVDMPITRLMTRSGINETSYDGVEGSGRWVAILLLIPALIALLAWYLFVPSLPVLLMGWLVEYPLIFKPLGNRTLKAIIFFVAVAFTYWWLIALMAWGLYWLLVLLVVPVSCYCFGEATAYLDSYVPHQRCPKCRHIHTIAFDHDEVTGTKYMKGYDIRRDKLLDTTDSRYQTWTQVTTHYTDGSTTSRRENVRNHKMRHDTYRYIDIELTYLVTYYLNHFVCSHCKFHETSTSTTQEVVDSKITGSHTGTESYEV